MPFSLFHTENSSASSAMTLIDDVCALMKEHYSAEAPALRSARIIAMGSSKVVIKTLGSLGAEVHKPSQNTYSPYFYPATFCFGWKGETREEHWKRIKRGLDHWGPAGGPDLILDGGGEVTHFIHEGVKAEKVFAATGQLPDPSSTDDADLKLVLSMIRDGLNTDPKRYHNMKDGLVGVCVATNDGAKRLFQLQANGTLLFPAINVTESKVNSNLYGCCYALFDGIKRATNMPIHGKKAIVCGYDDASEGCAIALKQAGADVSVYAVDPNHALQADLRGFHVMKTPYDVVASEADIFVTNMNKDKMDVVKHVKRMKNKAIIYHMDPILDYAGVQQCFSSMQRTIVNPQIDKWVCPETKSSVTVLKNTGCPADLMSSWSFASLVFAVLELWGRRGTGKYENKVYDFPEHLEEKVSALHFLPKLTKTKKETRSQADQVFVPEEGQGNNVFPMSAEPNDSRTSEKITEILAMGLKACGVFGIAALGLMNAAKVSFSKPTVCLDLPSITIWGGVSFLLAEENEVLNLERAEAHRLEKGKLELGS
ncbi:adenosylhomocysteinase-like [Neltuma alba]|uniref:adenosylhomocysteinase-like n=1 Tax=Neltuma alba TaxID=207710 RepID=UPI0010A2BAD9|nr:adenosylhomocysteinase-like [Prosopis alba]